MPEPDYSDIGFSPAQPHADLGFLPRANPAEKSQIADINKQLNAPVTFGGIPIPRHVPSPIKNILLGALSGASMQQGQEALGKALGTPGTVNKDFEQAKQSPLYHLANILTSIPSYIVTSPYKALRAGQGAIEGWGSSSDKPTGERLLSSGVGGLSNLVVPEAVSEAAKVASGPLRKLAAFVTGRALARGGGAVAEAAASKPGELSRIGQEVLEKGGVGLTAKGTSKATQQAIKPIGQDIGDALAAVDQRGIPFNGEDAANRIEQEVLNTIQPGKTAAGARQHLQNLVDDLRSEYVKKPFVEAHAFKSQRMAEVNDRSWALREGAPAKRGMKQALGILSDELKQQASEVLPEAGEALANAEASYGTLSKAAQMAARTAKARTPLSELALRVALGGGLTAGTGSVKPAAIFEGLNVLRKYGQLPAGRLLYELTQTPESVTRGFTGALVPQLQDPTLSLRRLFMNSASPQPQQP